MKYKTLFRLFVKLIAVYVVVEGIIHIISTLSWLVQYQQLSSASPLGIVSQIGLAVLPGCVLLLFGVFMFTRSGWVANLAIPSNRPYCHECGYEVSKVKSHICPECGTAFRAPASVQPTPDDEAAASGAASPRA